MSLPWIESPQVESARIEGQRPPGIPADLRITDYQIGDEETWLQLQIATGAYGAISLDTFERAYPHVSERGRRIFFVRSSNGTALGTCSAWVGSDPAVGRLHWLAVRPEAQGRGLGTALVGECLRRFQALGHDRGYLTTGSAKTSAIRIYERHGFQPQACSAKERQLWIETLGRQPETVHTMIVGGTGMLRGLATELGNRSCALSAIARTRRSLDLLGSCLRAGCNYFPFAVDYREEEPFRSGIERAIATAGTPTIAVGWFHDLSPARVFAHSLNNGNPVHFFHVVGSAALDPTRHLATLRQEFQKCENVHYHTVILGFEDHRWLTHSEICQGICEAIDFGSPTYVVGKVRPWSDRP